MQHRRAPAGACLFTRRGAVALALAAASALAGCAPNPPAPPPLPAAAGAQAFAFALFGDMPYSPREEPRVDALLRAINADAELQFAVHVGDIKGGAERCDEVLYRSRLQQLQQLRLALVYTPGDNEWTDCHRPVAGAYVPTERLGLLRRLFFPEPGRTLGQRPMAVRSQAQEQPEHAAFVENVMFERGGVVFGTVHVIGSRNDLVPWLGVDPHDGSGVPNALRWAEFQARQAANVAWLDRLFDEAQRRGAAGVVVAMQANPRFEQAPGSLERGGFDALLAKLRERTAAFGRPVLLLQGDDHELIIDQPWYRDSSPEPRLANFTRVQGFGSPRVHWIKVRVDAASSQVFRIEPQRVAGNP